MKKVIVSHILSVLMCTTACTSMAQSIVIVNGKKIPSSLADALVKQMVDNGESDTKALRDNIKQQLIVREVQAQEADHLGLGMKPEVRDQLALLRQEVLMKALQEDYLQKHPVSDADLKLEYERYLTKTSQQKEYHVRHILLDDEDTAKALIKRLKTGAKFEELAKRSRDKGSLKSGGDLDWQIPSELEKPFATAMLALKKGEWTETPIKTKYGYHIIRLDDIRPRKPATYADMAPRLRDNLQAHAWQDYLDQLQKKARLQ